ncbi:hypothetical protein DSL72_003913 [Monilinia vaccinii-corymbosi]|uniref:Uncharacterized protein n=1 Tax=Monilinia vaccinii-corymbosi TaxID=61207 RepID=A0A8A3P8C7_9HELO|nr:hypothetical protein DSL72_003913 [Monilinia vaccinii-corymbosi]
MFDGGMNSKISPCCAVNQHPSSVNSGTNGPPKIAKAVQDAPEICTCALEEVREKNPHRCKSAIEIDGGIKAQGSFGLAVYKAEDTRYAGVFGVKQMREIQSKRKFEIVFREVKLLEVEANTIYLVTEPREPEGFESMIALLGNDGGTEKESVLIFEGLADDGQDGQQRAEKP